MTHIVGSEFQIQTKALRAMRDAAPSFPAGTTPEQELLASFIKMKIAGFLGPATPFGVFSAPYDTSIANQTGQPAPTTPFVPKKNDKFETFLVNRSGRTIDLILFDSLDTARQEQGIPIPLFDSSASTSAILKLKVDEQTRTGMHQALGFVTNQDADKEFPNLSTIGEAANIDKTIGQVLKEATS